LIKIPLVTLIDTLDTLVVVNDYEEFRRATALLVEHLPRGFDFDVNISLFETTIRLLGGLLSAHLMAIDSSLGIYGVSVYCVRLCIVRCVAFLPLTQMESYHALLALYIDLYPEGP
jgi:hypothetical protein